MNRERLTELLEQYKSGDIAADVVLDTLRRLPYDSVGDDALLDHHRELRNGCPEVVFGENKSAEQIAKLLAALVEGGRGALATRVKPEKAEQVQCLLPDVQYHPRSQTLVVPNSQARKDRGHSVAVICAGTSDLSVAEEAVVTLEFLGHSVRSFTDVGVAGLHRLLAVVDDIRASSVAIVVAGMEAALPTVVAGLIPAPIVAIPTSVGYGVGIGGFVAMMGMLTSCSPGITVVNIDNGFGAAVAAARMIEDREPMTSQPLHGLHLHFDCESGAAGDMLMAAFLAAGVPEDVVRTALHAVDVEPRRLVVERIVKSGIAASNVVIDVSDISKNEHAHYHYGEIRDRIENAVLDSDVRRRALDIFDRMAEAEATLHGVTMRDVGLHEVGALDAIADVVGAAAALSFLSPQSASCSRVAMGQGRVQCAHGLLPVPSPAALEILKSAGAVVCSTEVGRELCTPTGAAILAHAVDQWGPMPTMTVRAIGYGAGDADLEDRPNVTRVVLGAVTAPSSHDVVELKANIDDMPAEFCEHVVELLFAIGALDVWWTAVTMKKSRPGWVLSVLVPTSLQAAASDIILKETTSLGVRAVPVSRVALERSHESVRTPWGPVRMKIAWSAGRVMNATPEFEDARAIARSAGVALKVVYGAAVAAWQQLAKTEISGDDQE